MENESSKTCLTKRTQSPRRKALPNTSTPDTRNGGGTVGNIALFTPKVFFYFYRSGCIASDEACNVAQLGLCPSKTIHSA